MPKIFEVQRSPGIILCSSCDNTLSSCSTIHMQVYFVGQNELLQAGMLELDTLPFLVVTIESEEIFANILTTSWVLT